ncbi:hypothetical protein K438DRAFT_1779404 [Mycena galopus ATCC 62051]|nr:hypothetical protein K438DRAFT_1779404 [Mycena galopus ATCC 62051]
MVLTRRASRAEKSIVRWLPNEVIAEVMSELSRGDLATFCRTSRLLHNIATPLLYRAVSFSKLAQLKAFLRTMKVQSRSTSLAPHVRQFFCSALEEFGDVNLTRFVKAITSVLLEFVNLELLDLLFTRDIDLPDLLQHGFFPNLSTFRCIIGSSASLPAFLNRHSRITHATLPRLGRVDKLDSIHLPNLKNYEGCASFVPFINFEETSLLCASLSWLPDNLDIDTPLLRLGTMGSLSRLDLLSPSYVLKEAALLQSTATHIPHLHMLRLDTIMEIEPLSRQDTLEISVCLESLTSLFCLALCGPRDALEHDPDSDLETITLWGRACDTLSIIKFNGTPWIRMGGQWRIWEP